MPMRNSAFDFAFFRDWLADWDASSLLFLRHLRDVSLINLSGKRSVLRCGIEVGKGLVGGVRTFIYDTRTELKKVVWPTREQTMNLTVLVIGVSIAANVGKTIAQRPATAPK